MGLYGSALSLRSTGGLAYAVQTVELEEEEDFLVGCWICTSTPNSARLMLFEGSDVAADFHPGDGLWRFFWLERPSRCARVDIYLQMSDKGEALFEGVSCYSLPSIQSNQ